MNTSRYCTFLQGQLKKSVWLADDKTIILSPKSVCFHLFFILSLFIYFFYSKNNSEAMSIKMVLQKLLI